MIKEDLDAVQDLATLKQVEEACAQDSTSETQRRWLDVASLSIEASEASNRAEECVNVVKWLAACDSRPHSVNEPIIFNNFGSSSLEVTPEAIDDFASSILDTKNSLRIQFIEALLSKIQFPERSYLSVGLRSRIRIDFLAYLPQELAVQILCILDVRDLVRCSQVSTKWRELTNGANAWERLVSIYFPEKRKIWAQESQRSSDYPEMLIDGS